MTYELTESSQDLIRITERKGLDALIQPLTKEIHLFDTYISGTSCIEDQLVFEQLENGEKLLLKREVSRFDETAIAVMRSDHTKLGYIPEQDSLIFARLMDAGKWLTAKVNSVSWKERFALVQIGIFLTDF